MNSEDYTLETCAFCEKEVVIYSKGITACPICGKPNAPCRTCIACVNPCPYGCNGVEDVTLKVTNPAISELEIEFVRLSEAIADIDSVVMTIDISGMDRDRTVLYEVKKVQLGQMEIAADKMAYQLRADGLPEEVDKAVAEKLGIKYLKTVWEPN